jgi:hypothetical protein
VTHSERRKLLTCRQVSQRFHRYAREVGLPLGVTPAPRPGDLPHRSPGSECPIEAVQPASATALSPPRSWTTRARGTTGRVRASWYGIEVEDGGIHALRDSGYPIDFDCFPQRPRLYYSNVRLDEGASLNFFLSSP